MTATNNIQDEKETVRFYFDPVCPWAWRAALWIREVSRVRPIQIEWRILSLHAINQGTTGFKDSHFKSEAGFRVMALLRRELPPQEANLMIGELYHALGTAHHDRQEDISQPEVVEKLLAKLELDPGLAARALSDPTTSDDVLREHEEAAARGGFGVPTLLLPGQDKGTFGPVINTVPAGEDAGQLWDRVHWLMELPEFFELKRSR